MIVKNQATVDAHGYVISGPCMQQSFRRLFAGVFVYIHIGVGFGVARFDYQRSPEPLCVGRVTSLIPTLFFLSDKESKTAGRRESGLLGDFFHETM